MRTKKFPSPRVSLVGRIVLLAASSALAFLMLELGLRFHRHIILDSRITDTDRLIRSSATFNKSQLRAFRERQSEAEDYFEGMQELRLAYRPYVERRRLPNQSEGGIHINSLGYRGEEFSVRKRRGTRRVLVYGGSFVWGTGALTNEETIPGHLERILDEQSDNDSDWEVINSGETGYVTSQEVTLLVHEGLLLEPDVVVFIDGYNDAQNVVYGLPAGYPGHYSEFNRWLSKGYKRPVRLTLEKQLEALQEESRILWESRPLQFVRRIREAAFETPDNYQAGCPELAARHLHNIIVVDALSKLGFQSVFAFQPIAAVGKTLTEEEQRGIEQYMHHNPKRYEFLIKNYRCYGDTLQSILKEKGITLVNLTDVFSKDTKSRYIDFSHLNGDGYRIIAEQLAPHILENLPE